MRDFKRLTIWQRSQALSVEVIGLDARRAARRVPGLTAQMRRAAMSIPANIAEGCGHESPMEFVRFLGIAIASAVELESHLLLARTIGVVPARRAEALITETIAVRRMCDRLRAVIRLAPTARTAPPAAPPKAE